MQSQVQELETQNAQTKVSLQQVQKEKVTLCIMQSSRVINNLTHQEDAVKRSPIPSADASLRIAKLEMLLKEQELKYLLVQQRIFAGVIVYF